MASSDTQASLKDRTDPSPARSDKEILEEARERMKKCIDEYSDERRKQKDDLMFSTLDQWPASIRSERENDPNGSRPCLTIDQINQYIVQVVNDMRQNKPAVKVRPVDDQADVDTAEVFQGIIRQIEDQSTAQVAYATSAESAVRVGEGYFRVITEYESETSFDQVIRIKRVPDMFCIYLGPHSMPDGSDSEYGFVLEWMPTQKFRRLYPKAKYTATEFEELQSDYAGNWWDNEKICVAEYFYFNFEKKTLCFLKDGTTVIKDSKKTYPKEMIADERDTHLKTTKWVKLTGIEILDKSDWAGNYIPIVKVIGKEAVVDGKKCCWGLVRPAKDSLRMYNYFASAITEKIGLSPKAPFIGAAGQFEGYEDKWAQANTKNFAYLEYNPKDQQGTIVPPPQRQMPAPVEVAMVQQLQQIKEDVQASLGMFKASLGKEQPNQSGKAILALTRESDTGTFHFADNQSISIQHCGRILVDLVPKIYDTARIVKILGEDGKMRTASIDPNLQQASMEQQDPVTGKIQNIYNLGVGEYDVSVAVGPSFNTKRLEAATMFTDLANTAKDPISGTVMRYLAIKNSDFNGADQAAEMMEKLLPPGLIQQEGQPNIDPRAQAMIGQLQQVIQAQGQELQKLQTGEKAKEAKVLADHDAKMKDIDLKRQEAQAQSQLDREKASAEIELKRWVAEQNAQLERDKASAEFGIKAEEVKMQKEKAEVDKAVKLDGLMPPEVRDKYLENKTIEDKGSELLSRISDDLKPVIGEVSRLSEESKKPKPTPKSMNRRRDKDGNLIAVVVQMDDGTTKEIAVH